MKSFSKMIAVIMMIAITTAMPAMANSDKNMAPKYNKEMVVKSKKNKVSPHKKNSIKTATIKVSQKNAKRKNVAAAARNVKGVKEAKWNAKSRTLTVKYDANKTSVSAIKRAISR